MKHFGRTFATIAATCLAAGFFSLTAIADTQPTARVARLTFTDGYVHIGHRDNPAGDPAQLNMPLVEGQTVLTGENGQAEVEFEDGSTVRITPNSTVALTHLTADSGGNFNTILDLKKGLAYFELRSVPKFGYLVDAAGDEISPAENATVRVNLDEPPAAIAVLIGSAHVERASGYKMDVHAGETFRSDISGTGRYFLTSEIATDSWDQWNEARDQAAMDVAPTQTAARDGFAGSEGYGWSDLDANGSWYNVPGQGQVWQPTGGDSADFDPYGNGSWLWYPNSGYLWASSYSWGWTPFRCGGWSYWNTFGWGWSPNAGCGLAGFSGYGGYGYGGGYGGYVNIVLPPRRGFPVHRPPGGSLPGVHPIIRVHTDTPAPGEGFRSGQRQINGVVAVPVRRIGQTYTPRGGSALGASLGRDYPIDRTTHHPVLGVAPVHASGFAPAYSSGFAPAYGSGSAPTHATGSAPVHATGAPPTHATGVPVYGNGVQESSFRPGPQQVVRTWQSPGVRPDVQQGMRPSQPIPQSFARPGGQVTIQSIPRPSAPQMQMSRPPVSAPPPSAFHAAPAASPAAPKK